MSMERTLAIIKTRRRRTRSHRGNPFTHSQSWISDRAIKSMRLTRKEAEGFYACHREVGSLVRLTEFMSSGKVVVLRARS